MGNTVIQVAPQAQYGRNPNGATAARDEWWSGQARNDADQSAVSGGIGYANQQAQNPADVGASENYGLASNENSGAGGHQQAAIGLAGTLARGQQPSQAAYQLQDGLNQATRQQSAFASGARGSAALATSSADQRANTANLQQNAYTQGGMLKSRDMAQGRGMLGSQLDQQGQQNNARLGQSDQFGQNNADLNDKYSLGMGSAAVGLGGVANGQDLQDQQYYNSGIGAVDAQSDAGQANKIWRLNAEKQKVSANTQDSK